MNRTYHELQMENRDQIRKGSRFSSKLMRMASAAAVAAILSLTAAGQEVDLKLSSKPLGAMLNEFAIQFDRQLVFVSEDLAGINGPDLFGMYQEQAALNALLSGTSLEYRYISNNTIAIGTADRLDQAERRWASAKTADQMPETDREKLDDEEREEDFSTARMNEESEAPTLIEPDSDESALAQSDESALVQDVIIVTGRRRDAELSIASKRNADQIVDTLSADNASRLPDNNIAESLGRIPGVSFQRNGETGNGEFISIRGLDSALVNIQFNGVNSGLANPGNRRVPLDGVSSDDIAEIRVAKSLLPQDEGTGVGGAVNITQRTPLARGKDAYSLKASLRPSDFSNVPGFKVGGSFTKVWDDTFGVNFSASFRRRHVNNFLIDSSDSNIGILPEIRDADGNVVSPQDILDLGLEDAGSAFDNVFPGFIPDSAIVFEEQIYEYNDSTRDTLTLSGAIDWRPNPSTLLTLGGRYSRRETDALEFSVSFDEDDRDFELINGQLVTEFDDPEIDVEAQLEDDLSINAVAFLKGTTDLEQTVINYQVSFARAEKRQPQTNLAFNFELDEDEVTFQPFVFQDTFFPVPDSNVVNDPEFVNAISDFPGTQELIGFERELVDDRVNDRYGIQFDLEHQLDWEFAGARMNAVMIGGKFERSKIREDWIQLASNGEKDLNIDGTYNPDGEGTADGALLGDFPGLFGGLESLAPIGSPLSSIGLHGIPRLNEGAFRTMDSTFLESFFAQNGELDGNRVSFFDAREDVLAGFIQSEIEIGQFTFIGGVRVEHYDGKYATPLELYAELEIINDDEDGDTIDETIDLGTGLLLDTIETQTENTELFPRLNVIYRPTETFQIRGGIGRSIARPTYAQLGIATSIDISLEADAENGPAILPGAKTISDVLAAGGLSPDQLSYAEVIIVSGNPELKNSQSLNLDLSFEYFPAPGTALTASLFHKEIDNFIFLYAESKSGTIDTALAEELLSEEAQTLITSLGGLDSIAEIEDLDTYFDVYVPQNGHKARVRGLELGVFHQFTWAPGFLADLGTFASVTFTDSEAEFQVLEPATTVNTDGGLQDDEALVALGFAEEGDGLIRQTSFLNAPDLTANASLYYEANGFDLALSASYQTEQFDKPDDFGLDQYAGSYFQLDLFASYTVKSKRYGKYEFYFEVADLTDSGKKVTDLNTVGRARNVFDEGSFNGREFQFGVRANF